jgi:endonuclease/exonuclease/phosphatase family metal-dependent hydrolase
MTQRFTFILFFFSILPAVYGQSATFLTYNIRYDTPNDSADAWPERRDFLAGQLRFHKPDVFGIQEGLRRQVEYLQQELPDYKHVGVGRDDGREAGEYSALFYRADRFRALESGTFWLSETPDKVSKGWDAALPRICTWALLEDSAAGSRMWVFNTHFDHIGKAARKASAALILQKISEKNTTGDPVVLMGDFNAEPEEEPIAVLQTTLNEARDASREPPFGPEGTFNGFKFREPVNRRIDYIFVSPGQHVLQYAVLSDSRNCHYPSDHLPVLVRVE